MGRLTHLLQEEQPQHVTQLDFGDKVTATVAQVVAQEAVNRLAPTFQALIKQMIDGGERVEAGVDNASATVNAAAQALESAVQSEIKAVQADMRKAVKALRDASTRDSDTLREGLAKAIGTIPDYSDQLSRIEAGQKMAVKAISDLPEPEKTPDVWDFDIKRNSNGFIQSVTAKAK